MMQNWRLPFQLAMVVSEVIFLRRPSVFVPLISKKKASQSHVESFWKVSFFLFFEEKSIVYIGTSHDRWEGGFVLQVVASNWDKLPKVTVLVITDLTKVFFFFLFPSNYLPLLGYFLNWMVRSCSWRRRKC